MGTEQMTDYEYSPLEFCHIRVLHLAPGTFDQPLTGALVHQSLPHGARHDRYRAISYAWGPPVFSKAIQLDGRLFRITETLYSALRGLRNPPSDGTTQLWADAICINQDDNDEKSSQVAMMAEIFRGASCVDVWLGDATPSNTLAFWTMRCVAADYPYRNRKINRENFVAHFERWRQEHEHEIHDLLDTRTIGRDVHDLELECFSAFAALSLKPWFHRLWVVQEVALAFRARLLCGPSSMDFEDVRRLMHIYNTNERNFLHEKTIRSDDYHKATTIFRRLWMVTDNARDSDIQTVWGSLGQTPAERFVQLLSDVYNLGVSEKRDIVYATRELFFSEPTDDLLPDYNITLTQLWHDVAIFVLHAVSAVHCKPRNLLSILAISALQRDARHPHLPSWVPDFGVINLDCSEKINNYDMEGWRVFAGGSGPPVLYCSRDSNVLLITGLIIISIKQVLIGSEYPLDDLTSWDPMEVSDDIFVKVVEWHKRCKQFLDELHPLHKRDKLVPQLQSLLRLDIHLDGFAAANDVQRAIDRYNARLELDANGSILADGLQLEVKDIGPFLYDKSLLHNLDTTRILAGMSNLKAGWVPQHARVGDFVALIKGAPFPFILRRLDGQYYSIVGDAYIEEIMKGEACPESDDGWTTLAIK